MSQVCAHCSPVFCGIKGQRTNGGSRGGKLVDIIAFQFARAGEQLPLPRGMHARWTPWVIDSRGKLAVSTHGLGIVVRRVGDFGGGGWGEGRGGAKVCENSPLKMGSKVTREV